MVKYKGKAIHPYESVYWNTTQEFFRGELGGGIARCVKCDDSLATMVMEEIKVKQVMNIVDDTGGSGNIPKVISELTPKYRIRKLTPKECFRLMWVDDADIDTIQASGISNSSQYKLAGNSIVVDVLYHIFLKAFVEKDNESQQLTFF